MENKKRFLEDDVQAFILAGGMGTRLKSVISDRQKVISEVKGRPFITYIFDLLLRNGIEEVVILVGWKGEEVKSLIGDKYGDLKISYSIEERPLGTAGALKNAESFIKTEEILVLNGDSYCHFDFRELLIFHRMKNSQVTVVSIEVEDTSRYGTLYLDETSRIVKFAEKEGESRRGLINAGVYLMSRSVVESIPFNQNCSLEKDVFPYLTGICGYIVQGPFIDIGTPEDYKRASEFFDSFAKISYG
ncbi:MAG: nucleotidyltransferase family protein [Syntrophales bacterium]|nr:nucleotidyltransferase family protein [Syntrophales bacterium]